MTMEEHCPHGSNNAVFCNECERDDIKERETRDKKASKEKGLAAEFMTLARGLPAHKAAKIMRQHVSGVDYTGSPKKDMAKDYARGGCWGFKLRDRAGLKEKLKEEPRPSKAAKEARVQKNLLARKVKRLDNYEAVHGIDSDEMAKTLMTEGSDVIKAYAEHVREELAEAKLRLSNAETNVEWMEAKNKVVAGLVTKRKK